MGGWFVEQHRQDLASQVVQLPTGSQHVFESRGSFQYQAGVFQLDIFDMQHVFSR